MSNARAKALAEKLARMSPEERAKLKALLKQKKTGKSKTADRPKGVAPRIPATKAEKDYPLSHAQQRLAVIQEMEGSSRAYHLGGVFRLRGELDLVRAERAIRAVVARHESLRTQFDEVGGELRQRVEPVENWYGFAVESSAVESLFDWSRHRLNEPLDLARDPLFSATFAREKDGAWGLLLKLHHIIGDGASIGVLQRDLQQAFAAGDAEGGALPPLKRQYRDYAAWSRERADSAELEPHRNYWQEQFGELPEPLSLNTDFPRPKVKRSDGDHLFLELSADVAAKLEKMGQAAGATPFMTWLATIYGILARWSRQSDLVIGTPVAGRELPELQEQIGFFVNTLPIRIRVDGSQPFAALVGQVKQTVLAGVTHQSFPFDRIVDELRLERDTSRSPLFDVMMAFEMAGSDKLRLFGLVAEELEVSQATSKTDLTFILERHRHGLKLDLGFATSLFEPATVRRLAESWRTFVESVAHSPDQPLALADILTATERERVTSGFNRSARVEYPRDADIVSLFADQVRRRPDAIAVQADGVTMTYAELNRRSTELAVYLVETLRVDAAEPVVLATARAPCMVVGLLGILKAGAAYLPLNLDTPAERAAGMVRDAKGRVMLHDESGKDFLADQPLERVDLTAIPSDAPPAGWQPPLRTAQSLAYIVFTSGSTGQPKGTLVEDRGVVRLVQNTNYIRWDESVRILQTASLTFDASALEIWGALLNGGCLCMPQGNALLELEGLGELLRTQSVNTLLLTTGLFNQVVEFVPESLGGLRTLLTGGEKASLPHVNALRQRYPSLDLVNAYGPTENATASSYYSIKQTAEHDVPIGGPISNSTLFVLDDHGNPVPVGVTGEIYTGGDGLARGYLNRPRLTAEKFVPHPFGSTPGERLYRTGDLGYWNEAGQVMFIGRMDDQVKIRGFRIELGEVETALQRQAGIQHAVVVARPLGGTRELVAYYVADTAFEGVASLRGALGRDLPNYMIPTKWVALDELPLNVNGKVDRRRLPAPTGESDEADEAEAEAPDSFERGSLADQIASIWCQILGVEQCRRSHNFFSSGGDSIKAIQLVARIRQEGFEFKLTDVFAQPVLADLIMLLETRPRQSGGAKVFAAFSGSSASTAVQHWFADLFPEPHDRFCQTVLLKLPANVQAEPLQQALTDLLDHHDVLRSSARKTSSGLVHEVSAPGTHSLIWAEEDWTTVAAGGIDDRRCDATEALLAKIDLGRGRLVATGLFRTAGESQLFWAIHHWAVDGISWRILAEDLRVAYTARVGGHTPELAARSAPLGKWAEAWEEFANSESAKPSRRFWENQLNGLGETGSKWLRSEQTPKIETVRRWAPTGLFQSDRLDELGAELQDVLLGSLACAWGPWSGETQLALTLEGHGREGLTNGPPIERTVGWFTSLYPLVLPTRFADSREALHTVRAERARLPGNGVSFLPTMGGSGLPGVSFNYLGEFGGEADDSDNWRPTVGAVAPGVAPHLGGPFGVDLIVTRVGDELEVRIWFDPDLVSKAQIDALIEGWEQCLSAMAEMPSDGSMGPADLTLAGWRMEDWRALLQANDTNPLAVADVMPLTPMQSGLLFQYLQEPSAKAYCDLVSLLVTGPIERPALDAAWVALLETYPNLRARFWHKGVDEPVQVIRREPAPPPGWHDFSRDDSPENSAVAKREQLADGRFDLAVDGPLRMDVIRRSELEHEWVIRFHHVALDGWSSGLIMNELKRLYAAELRGESTEDSGKRPSFAAYLQRQQAADVSASLAYWQERLRDAPPAAEVPPAIARLARSGAPVDSVSVQIELAGADYEKLKEWSGDGGVTLNAVLQAAWALTLGQLNASRDVVFGVTVSGREGGEPGVSEVVGLLINTLPCRASWESDATVVDVVRQLHQGAAEMQEHAGVPLAELQSMSDAGELFTHSLIFENYPDSSDELNFVDAEGKECTWRTEVLVIDDPMHFEFGLLVAPGPHALSLRAVVDPELYPEDYTRRLLQDLVRRLMAMVMAPDVKVADLPEVLERRAASVVVSSTYTAEPILPTLAFWGRELSLPIRSRCASFNQVFQDLLGSRETSTIRVVLARFEDWLPAEVAQDSTEARERVETLADDLIDGLRSAVGRGLAERMLVVVGPSGGGDFDENWRDRLQRRMEKLERVEFWWGERIAEDYGCDEVFDPEAEALGAVPYTDEFYAALGTLVARVLDCMRRPPLKLVATDADETLWQGVVGEVGRDALTLPVAMTNLQTRLSELERRGCLLAIASKNDEQDVRDVLANHPGMHLREEHLVAIKANWRPKADNLRELAAELNLGADSFVFIDDNPVELAEMAARLPEVGRLPAPRDEQINHAHWSHVWLLDAAAPSSGLARTQKYREHAERESVRSATSSLAAFRASLELHLEFAELESDWERASELTLRTNQFHAAPTRWEAGALQAWAGGERDPRGFIVGVKDRFGDYGQCGLVRWEPSDDRARVTVETFLLSCRAMGRGVEHAMLRELAVRVKGDGVSRIGIRYIRMGKNQPAVDWLESLPGEWQEDEGEGRIRVLSVAEAAAVEIAEEQSAAPANNDEQALARVASTRADRSAGGRLYERIAREMNQATLIVDRVRATVGVGTTVRRVQATVPPETRTEVAVHEIWQEVLGLSANDFGVTDDFFLVGGHSLKAVQMLSRFDRAGLGEVSLARFFADPTIRGLVALIREDRESSTESPPRDRPAPAPPQEAYPLSRVQRRFWVMEQARGEGPSPFHMIGAFRLDAGIEPDRLRAAWHHLVLRHESLRTRIEAVDTEMWQKVDPRVLDAWEVFAESLVEIEAFREQTKQWAMVGFDFEQGPLWRVRMDRLASGEWGLAFCLHHMIADGWSMGILARELSEAYTRGKGWEAPAPGLHYKDYAWIENVTPCHAGGEFWREAMKELPVPLELPSSRSRPAEKSTRGAILRSRIDAGTWGDLLAAGRNCGATPFAVALGLLRVLIHKQAGVGDSIIGTPVAGRSQPEWESVVGCFVNLLPLRLKVEEGDTFAGVLRREAENTKACLAHQMYPFDVLVAEVAPRRDPARAPLFDVLIAFQNAGSTDLWLDGSWAQPVELDSISSQYDWALNCFPTDAGELEVVWEYDEALFDEARMRRVLAHWQELAAALARNPGLALSRLPHLSIDERRSLETWSRRPEDCREVSWNVVSRFVEVANKRGAALAVSDTAGAWTYAELRSRALQVAAVLVARFDAGAAIGVIGPRNREWLAVQLGIFGARMAYVPVDSNYPTERQNLIVRDSGMKLLISTGDVSVDQLDVKSAASISLRADATSFAPVQPSDLAYVIYTSGSTGRPKGVEITHGAFAAMIAEQVVAFGVIESDVAGQFASMSFDAAMSEVYLALTCGAQLSLASEEAKQDLSELAAWLDQARVSVITLPPALVGTMAPEAFRGVRTLITAGEKADREVVERFRGKLRYLNAYGPTEASVCATFCDVFAESGSGEDVPIGLFLPSTAGRVLDAHGRLAPIGVVGELVLVGPTLARGYHGQPERTAEAFAEWTGPSGQTERIYRTGDRCAWSEEGRLVFHGRNDEQVKLRGFRVELGEIADLARRDGAGDDVLAVVEKPENQLVLYGVGWDEAAIETVRQRLVKNLPGYMVPAEIVGVPAWPLTVNGKIDRGALRLQRQRLANAPSSPVNELTELELIVGQVWQAVIGQIRIAADTDFFRAGGDSIRALAMIARLREQGWTGSLPNLFRDPRLGVFTATLTPAAAAPPSARTNVSGQLSPIQQWFFDSHPKARWSHFNQVIALRVNAKVDAARMEQAWRALGRRHPMLRARFNREESGDWRRTVAAMDLPWPDEIVSGWPEVEVRVARAQRNFDLASGPLIQAVAGRTTEGLVVVLVGHHLVVDWVSWRQILADWESLYHAETEPDPAFAPDDFGHWADELKNWVDGEDALAAFETWRQQNARVRAATDGLEQIWPRRDWGAYGQVEVAGADVRLPKEGGVSGAELRNRILASWVRSLSNPLSGHEVTVELESHGRRFSPNGRSIEGVVGWFTALYPIVLSSDDFSGEFGTATKRVTEVVGGQDEAGDAALAFATLRDDAPSKAECALGFNFLGSFDKPVGDGEDSVFVLSDREFEGSIDPDFPRDHAIDLTAFVMGGNLQLRLAAPPAIISAKEMKACLDFMTQELENR